MISHTVLRSYQGGSYLSRIMRKTTFCICENKEADQLRGCFRYIDSTIPLLPKPLAIFCGCTARFVSDLVGNPEDRFSHNEAYIHSHDKFDSYEVYY